MPRPMKTVPEKSKDFFGSMRRLLIHLDKWRTALFFALFLAIISAVLSLIAPNKLSDLTDTISSGLKPNLSEEVINEIMMSEDITLEDKMAFSSMFEKVDSANQKEILALLEELPESIYKIIKPKIDFSLIKKYTLILFTLVILSALFNYIQSLLLTYVSNKYAKKLRTDISDKINRLPLKYFDNNETGDILSRITNDVDTIGMNLNQSLASLVLSLTLLVGSLIMMFVTNGVMAITAIVSSVLGFIIMFVILSKSQKYFIQRQETLGDLNGFIEEVYSGHNIVRIYNANEEITSKFKTLNERLYNANRKSQFLSGMMHPIMGFVGNFGYVAVCVVGALLVVNNHISFGVIVAFILYIRMFINPLSQISQSMTSLQTTVAAAERVFEFADEKEESSETTKVTFIPSKVKGEIEFKDVKFSYEENKPIIKNFNVKIKPGSKVAIVGPTGAGKTTIVNLLMKFYNVEAGDILIDGISIKDLSREDLRKLFIMVLQDTWLFSGTIKENIKFNSVNVTDDEIINACKIIGVDHFINTLPDGLNHNIKDNDSISQGQKQLLTIARGMIKNAPLIILDEATSSVDTRTEELVQNAMDILMKGKTSFIIAHRLSTIKNADVILVMNDGNIIEIGTHDELMKSKGFYSELYNSQFEL